MLLLAVLCGCEALREEPPLPLIKLDPGVIITTPEGTYILDLLWLKTGEEKPVMPSKQPTRH